MKKYECVFKRVSYETYFVEAKDRDEADELAREREENEAPDDEVFMETDLTIKEVDKNA
jgi:hypothetical protein